ncbi:hypothetical protein AB5I41_00830 [Sphingomonas sp. MMS24-JH45]
MIRPVLYRPASRSLPRSATSSTAGWATTGSTARVRKTMTGGYGADTFVVDDAGDVVADGEVEDRVLASVSVAGIATGRIELTGSANIDATAARAGTTIVGNAGNSTGSPAPMPATRRSRAVPATTRWTAGSASTPSATNTPARASRSSSDARPPRRPEGRAPTRSAGSRR